MLLVGVLLAVAVLVVGALGWRLISGGGTQEVRPAASAFDPFGTEGEKDDQARLATDDDPATSWPTETYQDRDLAAAKGGVGLALDLGKARGADVLEVQSPTADWDAVAYVFDELPDGPLDTWGEPVAGAEGINGDLRLDLGGAEGRVVLLWITRVGTEGRVEVADAVLEVSR
ncbi:hypothetical protein BH24ACT4_BH24ACT4_01500 [soil metagenome]